MKNIYLVGFMGTGKTHAGMILARKLHKEFLEMDEEIERRQGMRIADIFSQKGEPYFRRLEKDLLLELAAKEDLVVSCGGGLMCNEEHREVLKGSGTVVCLTASAEVVLKRTRGQGHRPLLNVDNPLATINRLLAERSPHYQLAHCHIDTDRLTPEEVAERIADCVHNG